VGKNPYPFSFVFRAHVGCAKHVPFRIVPERGQVTQNPAKSKPGKFRGILHERVSWSNLANDSRHVSPHSRPLAVDSCALSGCADVLAWKSAGDDINPTEPWLAVECLHVVPNWETRQDSVSLAGKQYAPRVVCPFDGANRSPSHKM
jgi:hypothetical protein